MKNLILQHYTGTPGELEKLSIENIKQYAEFCGADYKFLEGDLFNPDFTPPCQKMYMLSEDFDEYDMVVMLDIDMFARRGMTKNVFTDTSGIGMYASVQRSLHQNISNRFPLINTSHAYWGGAIWRLTLEQRIAFRSKLDMKDMYQFSGNYEDEGMMSFLAGRLGIKPDDEVIPGEYAWCHCSYREGIENAELIHIRTKVTPTGPKREKIHNYRELVKKGLIHG